MCFDFAKKKLIFGIRGGRGLNLENLGIFWVLDSSGGGGGRRRAAADVVGIWIGGWFLGFMNIPMNVHKGGRREHFSFFFKGFCKSSKGNFFLGFVVWAAKRSVWEEKTERVLTIRAPGTGSSDPVPYVDFLRAC